MLNWLNRNFEEGFYFPFLKYILETLEKKLSLNSRIKKYINHKLPTDADKEEETPPWVSELYQFIYLILGFVGFLFFFNYPSVYLGWIFISLLGYRLFEIFIFTGNWVFVHKEETTLHSYRRSLAGFLLNVFELALYVSVISLLGNCEASSNLLFSEHLKGIIAFNFPEMKRCVGCQILSYSELIISVLVILVVIGALVGGIERDEVDKKKNSIR